MTKAEKLVDSQAYFTDTQKVNVLALMKLAMAVGYDTGVKMSAISKSSLIHQWFNAELPQSSTDTILNA